VKWHTAYTKQAQRDAKKLAANGLRSKVESLLATVADNPYKNPPPYEKLVGDLIEEHSRRITIPQGSSRSDRYPPPLVWYGGGPM